MPTDPGMPGSSLRFRSDDGFDETGILLGQVEVEARFAQGLQVQARIALDVGLRMMKNVSVVQPTRAVALNDCATRDVAFRGAIRSNRSQDAGLQFRAPSRGSEALSWPRFSRTLTALGKAHVSRVRQRSVYRAQDA